jgi:hypothetical protein
MPRGIPNKKAQEPIKVERGVPLPRTDEIDLAPLDKADEDGVELTIEMDSESTSTQKKTPLEIAKELASKMFNVADEPKTSTTGKKPTSRKSPASKFFQKKASLIASGLIWLLIFLVPKLSEKFEVNGENHQLAPTQQQSEEIVLPLLRILDRHIVIGEINPDVADVSESLMAIIAYGFEVKANLMTLEALQEFMKEGDKRGRTKNQTAFSGIDSLFAHETNIHDANR